MTGRTIASAAICCGLVCVWFGSASAQLTSRNTTVNQSARVLFEQAQKAIKGSSYAEARSLLSTLINTHPDSEYVPRAKLSIADSWYSERAFKQAELEYRDFLTFFPNRPEVAEAQR